MPTAPSTQRQGAVSGGITMKLSTVKVLGSLCVLLADGFQVSEDDASPKVIGPKSVTMKAHPGEQLLLHCEAFPNCDDDVTLIYWLVNGSFPEEMHSRGRMEESAVSSVAEGTILHRSLLLNVTSEDLKHTFTCVVQNAFGIAHKRVTLKATGSSCYVRKRKRRN